MNINFKILLLTLLIPIGMVSQGPPPPPPPPGLPIDSGLILLLLSGVYYAVNKISK